MANRIYDTNSQIPSDGWETFCDLLTESNQGRLISIDLVGPEIGDVQVAAEVPFAALDYDSPTKGDALILSYGQAAPLTTHTITNPSELWVTEDENGQTNAMEIVDIQGRKTIITFV